MRQATPSASSARATPSRSAAFERPLARWRDRPHRPRLSALRRRRQQRLVLPHPGRHRRADRDRPRPQGPQLPHPSPRDRPGQQLHALAALGAGFWRLRRLHLPDGPRPSRRRPLLGQATSAATISSTARRRRRRCGNFVRLTGHAADASGLGARLRAVDARLDGLLASSTSSRPTCARRRSRATASTSSPPMAARAASASRGKGFHAGYLDYYQGWHPKGSYKSYNPKLLPERRQGHRDAARARLPADRPRLLDGRLSPTPPRWRRSGRPTKA